MQITNDKAERKNQRLILVSTFPEYDPKFHDAFVNKYNAMLENKKTKEYLKNRGL